MPQILPAKEPRPMAVTRGQVAAVCVLALTSPRPPSLITSASRPSSASASTTRPAGASVTIVPPGPRRSARRRRVLCTTSETRTSWSWPVPLHPRVRRCLRRLVLTWGQGRGLWTATTAWHDVGRASGRVTPPRRTVRLRVTPEFSYFIDPRPPGDVGPALSTEVVARGANQPQRNLHQPRVRGALHGRHRPERPAGSHPLRPASSRDRVRSAVCDLPAAAQPIEGGPASRLLSDLNGLLRRPRRAGLGPMRPRRVRPGRAYSFPSQSARQLGSRRRRRADPAERAGRLPPAVAVGAARPSSRAGTRRRRQSHSPERGRRRVVTSSRWRPDERRHRFTRVIPIAPSVHAAKPRTYSSSPGGRRRGRNLASPASWICDRASAAATGPRPDRRRRGEQRRRLADRPLEPSARAASTRTVSSGSWPVAAACRSPAERPRGDARTARIVVAQRRDQPRHVGAGEDPSPTEGTAGSDDRRWPSRRAAPRRVHVVMSTKAVSIPRIAGSRSGARAFGLAERRCS